MTGQAREEEEDQIMEYRNVWSKMVATIDTLVNKTQGEKVTTSVIRRICYFFYTGYIFWRCGYISGWVNRGYIFWRCGYISGWVSVGNIFRRGYIFGYEVPQKCSHLQNWLHFLVRFFWLHFLAWLHFWL